MMAIQSFSTIFSPCLLGLPSPQPADQYPVKSPSSHPICFLQPHVPSHVPVFLETWPTRTSASWPCLVSAWSHTWTNHLGQLPPWLPHLSTKPGLTGGDSGVTWVGLLRINCLCSQLFPCTVQSVLAFHACRQRASVRPPSSRWLGSASMSLILYAHVQLLSLLTVEISQKLVFFLPSGL